MKSPAVDERLGAIRSAKKEAATRKKQAAGKKHETARLIVEGKTDAMTGSAISWEGVTAALGASNEALLVHDVLYICQGTHPIASTSISYLVHCL